ncbi:MAG: Dipeptide transport system permease protein DppB [Gemmatimonadaceae bacterium]|nr:Dipeptide transport system permease protein DppB [Gemmatimonadaceae bacterium]
MTILRRIAAAVVLLLVVSVLVFALIHAAPGGPLTMYLENPNVRPEDIVRLKKALGLDRSLAEQYIAWLRGFVVGEWGYSFSDGRPVAERLAERVPATIELMAVSLLLAAIAAVPAGVVSAVRRGRFPDGTVTAISLAGISLPVFWFGLVLQLVFAVALGWLPSSGRSSVLDGGLVDRLRHMILPAIMLAAVHAAAWSRYVRAGMIDVLGQRFLISVRARGVPERQVVLRHALRNALLPFVTVVLLDAAIMVSGAVVTESVFAWPGLGGLFTEALARRDYTVLMAFLMISSATVIVLNLLADAVYRQLDPRVAA